MSQAVAWLPADALQGPRAAQPAADAIAAWGRHWFATGDWSAGTRYEPAAAGDWALLREEPGFRIAARPKAMLALAFALLGEKLRTDLSDADLKLLRRLAARALDDLAARLQTAFPSQGDAPRAPGKPEWQLTVGTPAEPWLALVVDEPMLAAATRRTYSASRRDVPLAKVSEAVAGIDVSFSARIGSALLAIEQIDLLEIGDLLLLDQCHPASAQLTVAGRTSDLRFTVGDAGDRLTLTMQDL